MDELNIQEALAQIGFTEYEARVYLALLADYPANGYQISKQSGVPRSMVYEALSRLRLRGAVLETVEERATLYRPLPPDVLLDRHQDEHHRLMSGLRDGLNAVYRRPADLGHVWTISGRQTALVYAAQLVGQAQATVYLVLGDGDLDALRGQIEAACQRGVEVNTLLTGQGKLDCGQVVYHPPLESEIQGLTGTLLVVADDAEMLIASDGGEALATITRNPNLVLIARQFVWMELFTQRVYARLGADVLARLEPDDRRIFESLTARREG